MSETVTYKGILQEIPIENSIEETCKNICNSNGINEIYSYNSNWQAQIEDSFYNTYIVYQQKLYKVESKNEVEFDDIFNATTNSDGTVNYIVRYYNGGCSFGEAIECALNNLNKNHGK